MGVMKKLYTYQEVAHLLGYKSTRTISRLVKSGKLKVVAFNERVKRITDDEVKKYLKSLS